MLNFTHNKKNPDSAQVQYLRYLQYGESDYSLIHNRPANSFFYDHRLPKSYVEQLLEYKRQNSYNATVVHSIDDLGKNIKNISVEAAIIQSEIATSLSSVNDNVIRLTNGMNQNFKELIGDVNLVGEKVVEALDRLEFSMSWRLDAIHTQISQTNNLLSKILHELKIPEKLREKRHYIEVALNFFKNANKDKDYYNEAMINFKEAEAIGEDYLLSYYLGLMHFMTTDKFLDLDKAEIYLARCVFLTKVDIPKFASRASIYRSRIAYVQQNHKKSFEYAIDAHRLNRKSKEAQFQILKVACYADEQTNSNEFMSNNSVKALIYENQEDIIFLMRLSEDHDTKYNTTVITSLIDIVKTKTQVLLTKKNNLIAKITP